MNKKNIHMLIVIECSYYRSEIPKPNRIYDIVVYNRV